MADFDSLHSDPRRRENKYLDRLLGLWANQNAILYGRIQNMCALQAAIVAAWYVLFSKDAYWAALTASGAGILLSSQIAQLILCDLEWKRRIGDEIRKEADDLMPKVPDKTEGWRIMKRVAHGLWSTNVVLFLFTILWMNGYRICLNNHAGTIDLPLF